MSCSVNTLVKTLLADSTINLSAIGSCHNIGKKGN